MAGQEGSIPLAPGERLGPYEIIALIGAGGMGEVYRAYDPRLQRRVALKIVHPSLAVTPEHLDRFGREARAAGSLHHPNILVVFDVGIDRGLPYVISELLEGQSLRERLDEGPLPYRKALDYGIQIAHALGAAHARGIWHRDVKPANVFVTSDGRIKLLDFGLAKLTEAPEEAGSEDSTADGSAPGGIRGTAGYMSPEQARGEKVDHRTDIFSLGVVLYEMLTGVRAFRRGSTVETLHAIIREEPKDVLEINPALPPAAAITVRRCLEKNVEERFQSARDLAFQLQQLREGTISTRALVGGPRSRVRDAILVSLIAAAVGAAGYVGWRSRTSQPAPAFEQLTFSRGRVGGARFAAEAQSVVYSVAGEGNRREVWRVNLAEGPTAQALGYGDAEVLAARRGELALSADPQFAGGRHFVGRLVLAPIAGGGPLRELEPHIEHADWDPSGTSLAAVFTRGAGHESRLDYAGRTLHKVVGSIRWPRFSPDGQRIAFLEDTGGGSVGGRVSVVDLEGRLTALTDVWPNAQGLAWSARGDEIWFTAGALWSDRSLHAVDMRGRVRTVYASPSSLTLWDVARDGRVLFSRDEESRGILGMAPGEAVERDLSLNDNSSVASLSADGRSILFTDRFGVYVRATDGSSPPLDLGFPDVFADDLSPDGQLALVTTARRDRLVMVPRGAGERRELPSHGITSYGGAWWLPDGRTVLFLGAKPREATRPYVQAVDGGAPRALGEPGTRSVAISSDGQWVAGTREAGITVWPIGGGPGKPVPGSGPEDRPVAWTADGKALWIYRWAEVPSPVFRIDVATGQRHLERRLVPGDNAGVETIVNFRITPSGDSYFYTYRRVLSKLYLARHLR